MALHRLQSLRSPWMQKDSRPSGSKPGPWKSSMSLTLHVLKTYNLSLIPGRAPCSQETRKNSSLPLGRVHAPQGPGPKPFSAGADAAHSGPSWTHKAQLLLLIDAQLVTTAPSPGSRWDPVVSLRTRGQQEAHTASNEHMPNAVDVEVVVLGLHKSIEQDGTPCNEAARAQVEKPAAPRRWVAVPAADTAERLGEAEKWGSGM